jgi:hypothetical protein
VSETGRLVGGPGLLEIACDESGSEGENLVGGETDVFAHASVRLTTESAAECVLRTRARIGSPATEYKANHLLRVKHRAVLEWLLEPSGPIHGNAHVQLIDKTFFLVNRIVDLVAPGPGRAAALYRDGPRSFGAERWQPFLVAANNVLRVRNRREGTDVAAAVEDFFGAVEVLRRAPAPGQVRRIVELLGQSGPRVAVLRQRLADEPIPLLDPMIPAMEQTIAFWSTDDRPVAIVHDEQPALTGQRVAHLKADGRLADLRFVDSRSDPRVQVADFLAGVARKIASQELNGRGDATLTALLRPYVDRWSIWGDGRSWAVLGP